MSLPERGSGVVGMRGVQRVHFVGIGGAGMCGIAELLIDHGYTVTGSDLKRSRETARLAARGATVRLGHDAAAVAGADVVVVSSAVSADNVEVASAHRLRIPVVARAEMLGELMRHRHGIAVAGTHGKTTTASLIASVFQAAGLDPTYVIGAPLAENGGNARLGRGTHLIAEADESDASFLHLAPIVSVITNIDRDHLEAYDQDFERLLDTFVEFVQRLPFYGAAVVCGDDRYAAGILGRIGRPSRSYGLNEGVDYRAVDITGGDGPWSFTALRPDREALPVVLPLPGCHNVQNALAAVAVATEEGVADDGIVAGLRGFGGVSRRFETRVCRFEGKRVTLVDDYGHHPTELERVVATARRIWPERRLVMVFQPHRFSRTRDLYDEFVDVLSNVDELLVAEVYPAGELPISGADGAALAGDVQLADARRPTFVPTPESALERLRAVAADDDVVVVQGAGDIAWVAEALRNA
ncbi:MAG: UDP-N-acetylmuramate--L-alanine ligase [Gammaproteobacteria bacterium]|nr:UDP-N-acetylmuramate--L-alanine ligase [Gammaproteobacteria bacterium]MYF27858.1 UDP-N-acetylmuramate--L-alanine ligase [Gammaproteobacteria bacterium]MYK48595.1 UDP-N-acetylmuramate--L-alanine ligase [Gammaproteobacteria bacterium]